MQEVHSTYKAEVERRHKLVETAKSFGTLAVGAGAGIAASFIPETESLKDHVIVAGALAVDGLGVALVANFARRERY